MRQTNWCLIVLSLTRLCIGAEENVRQKRQILPDQPRIVTENGHLIFQSGVKNNITFRSGTGGVFVDNLDLKQAVTQVHTNKDAIARLQGSLASVNVTHRVTSLENRLVDYQSFVDDVNNDRTQVEEDQRAMDSRLNRVETQMTNVSGIPIQVSHLQEKVTALEHLIKNLEEASTSLQALLTTNECLSNPCQNGGTCLDMYNGYLCRCPPNWQGQHCTEDVNECYIYAGTDMGCQNGATCINSQGSFSCQCTTNWYGIHCSEQHNDCTGASHAELCGHGTCVNEDRILSGQPRYRCICETGWTKSSSGPACTVDVDECATGTHCSVNPPVQCINIPGSFVCGSCPPGYTGNGHACYDIDECADHNGGCSTSPRVECINTIGSRDCGPCPGGYLGNGVSCRYVGLCSQNNGGCHHLATCSETTGFGVTCLCTEGYFGSGLGPNGCQEQSHAGACASSPCNNGAVCRPVGSTGFVCACRPGFSGLTCSTVVDACLSHPCQNGGTCISQGPGYSCECNADFTGADCQEAQQDCGGNLYGETGSFRYPRTTGVAYPHGANCQWVISTDPDKILTVTFPVFSLEEIDDCSYDFLQIHDGRDQSLHKIGRYCGTSPPNGGSLNSTHSQLYFWFKSDESIAHDGFEVHWTSHPPVCGGYLNSSNHGEIKSPGYPGNYPNNRDCEWTVVVSPESNIIFNFALMALEYHDNCSYDYLEIRDGESYEAPLIHRFCSSENPVAPVITTGPYAYVQFHSDDYGSGGGFHILYLNNTDGRQGCGGVLSGSEGEVKSPGYPNPYQRDNKCVWVITVARGSSVQLSFTDLDLRTSSSCSQVNLKVRDGSEERAPTLVTLCGTDLQADIRSTGNVITLELYTDEHIYGRGFKAKWTTACGGTFTGLVGQIQSPNWPDYYPGSKTCDYVIEVPDSQIVRFELTANGLGEGLDCTDNYIEFHDGATQDAPLIGARLCEGDLPLRIMSTGSYLTVRFATTGSINNQGFRGTFTAVGLGPEGCGGVYNSDHGTIKSPGYPNEYPHGVNCTWYINAPPGHIIRLTFLSFSFMDPEIGNTCLNDFVEIYNNSTMFEGSLQGRHCGSRLPEMVTSEDNVLVVYMQTDASLAREGFTASFAAINASTVCGSALTSASGVITSPNYPNPNQHDRVCEWTITAANGNQILLNITDLSFSYSECHSEFLEIRNGDSETAPLMDTYCFNFQTQQTTPQTLLSHSNKLYLKYRSTYQTYGRGFRLEYSSATSGCGGDLTTHTGGIMSPDHPQPYTHAASCYWTITVSQGSSVNLFFIDLHILSHYGICYSDFLEIKEKDRSGTSLGKFCGTRLPQPVMTKSNHVWLRWKTEGSTVYRGFKLQYHTNCNRHLTGISGVIESPNFPNPYPEHTNCTWVIEAPEGNRINVSFAAFSLEEHADCEYDILEIKDGGDSNARQLSKLCGTNFPDPVQSTGNRLWLNFIADHIVAYDGFRLEWVVDGCGGHLFGSSGTITSPNYPQRPTQRKVECQWTITVDTGNSIELTVNTFDLESHPDCQYVVLKVIAGSDSSGPQLTQWCNKRTRPETVHTTGTTAFIYFRYDSYASGTGFNLTYKEVSGGCGGNFTASTATIMSPSYPNHLEHGAECEWNITVAPGHVVALTFSDFHFSDYNCSDTFVKLYDGPSTEAVLIAHLCWWGGSGQYNSSGNQMFIRMQTSGNSGRGFSATYTTGCGGTLNADIDGEISSPGFPGQYPWNTQCVWIISSSFHDRRVSLTFTHMDLRSYDGCTTEFVSVNDGLEPQQNQTGALQNHFCGTSVPATIVSEGSALSVIFRSANYSYASGFQASYSSAYSACGGDLTAVSGKFISPYFPNGYPNNIECVWNIKTPPGNRLQISFPNFQLDPMGEFNDDYVEIRSPNVSGKFLGRWYGNNVPDNLTSVNGAWIKFRSNEGGTAPGFAAEYNTLYGGDLLGDSGQIASPQYPQLYPANSDFTWTIVVSESMRVRVTFSDFAIELGSQYGVCNYDYVTIFDGTPENGVLLETLCGNTLPDPVYSETNQITVRFKSDNIYQDKGFLLSWSAVTNTEVPGPSVAPTTPGCSGQLVATAVPQNITSPGYPDLYPNDMDCFRTISVPEGNTVVINITMLYLEPDGDCLADYLKFYDGDTTDATVIGTYCHLAHGMGLIQSRSNILSFVFHTDSVNNGPGFVLTYEIGCGGFMQSATGVINSLGYPRNYPANQNCSWEVQVLPGKTILLDFEEQFNIADTGECDHDYLMLLNGFSSQSPPLFLNGSTNTNGRYCGSSKPQRMQTSSNFLFANFVSDESNQEMGFSLIYSTVSLACGGRLRLTGTVTSGYFTSPNYPQNYPHNVDCGWQITAPANKRIRVDFEGIFSIETNTSCSLDYIEFHEGGTTNARRIGKPLCGNSLPATVFSEGNFLMARFRTDSNGTHAGFKAKYSIATCGGHITAANGIIMSPNYPDKYGNNLDCEWTIAGPVGHFLQITIEDFHIQSTTNCTGDFLEIRDGNSAGRSIFRECSGSFEEPIETSDSTAFIRFQSDGSGTDIGFSLKFQVSVEECGGLLNTQTGVIKSPNYPNQYPHNRLCTWDITVPEGRRVTLTFSDLRLEQPASDLCQSDYVEVINGYLVDSPTLGKFCGETTPTQPVESSGNTMRVLFYTDGSVSNIGFQAAFSSDREAECGGDITDFPGNITSPGFYNNTYDSNLQCVWRFSSHTANSTIKLYFSLMNLQQDSFCAHDFVEIREGEDINAPLVKKYCDFYGSFDYLFIPGNHAWVRFKTDSSGNHIGFRLMYDVKECGGFLTEPEGVITSPNYPRNFSERASGCVWKITAPEGTSIKVNITDLYVGGYGGSLRILNGGLPDSPAIALLDSPASYLLQSNVIRLLMRPAYYSSRVFIRFRMEYSSETEGCGGVLHSNQGSLSSPNHPSSYPHNTECRWDINVENYYQVSLHFNPPFDLEARNCTKDFVEVFDALSNGTLVSLGRWCHNIEPPDLRSTSTRMVVVFRSDAATNGNGFSARWDVVCGIVVTDDYGTITSPGFPSLYANNLSCNYIISPGSGGYISLEFYQFELEGGYGCPHDYIRVWEGNVSSEVTVAQGSSRNHTHLGPFCGSRAPPVPLFAWNQITVQFHTDASGQFKGFSLEYYVQVCNNVLSGYSDSLYSPSWEEHYFKNMNCSWNITASPGRIITLRFQRFDVEVSPNCENDNLTVYDGPDTHSHMIGCYCGNRQNIPDVIESTGNQMYITFMTNHEGSSRGFFGYYRSNYGPQHGCGGVLRQSNGTITSLDADGDGLYENAMDCEWLIYVNENKQVMLNVMDLNLQNKSYSHCQDYLRIYDGSTKDDELLKELCGSSVTNYTILASSNVVLVQFFTDWRESYAGFNLTFREADAVCGGAYIATSTPQTISSPNYPNTTRASVTCTWFIDSGDPSQHLRLHITDLQLLATLRCNEDEYLTVRDQPKGAHGQEQAYCGSILPHSFNSIGARVKIRYYLGTTAGGRGFQLTYQIADCNQNISSGNGHIVSPKYPSHYPANSNCTIQVTSPENTTLALYFNHFKIEDAPACAKDALEIKNSSSATVAKLCGDTQPSPIFMTDNVATLRFQSDAEGENMGYDIIFTSSTHGPGCGGNITGLESGAFTSPGYPGSFSDPMTCVWFITPVTGRGLYWRFSFYPGTSRDEDCENNYVSVYISVYNSSPLVYRYCANPWMSGLHYSTTRLMVRYGSTGNGSAPVFKMWFNTYVQSPIWHF